MSELDIKAVEANFAGWAKERAPDLKTSDAFERYAIELIFRDLDQSDDEIDAGWVGGGDDGGLDGIYPIINRRFMPDEYKMPPDVFSVELHLIQAKYENGFGETPIEKFQLFIEDLLTYSKGVDSFNYYNQSVKDRISSIRSMYEEVIGQTHTFTVRFWYASKSDQDPNPKVIKRVENLKTKVIELVSSANPEFIFWGARNLTSAFRNPPSRSVVLEHAQHFMCGDGSVVCIAALDKFAKFLTDENGKLREYILEPNVRDYAGKWNAVNQEIRKALESKEVTEFWWLNNGITVLADSCAVAAGKIEIVSPELVNKLQTSHEIFNYFSRNGKEDSRTVLVRIILPPNEQTRRRITKATNNQTPVSPLSLRATEDIHFDIEELLKLYGLFYDRRKGEYRRLRKPLTKIVSIKELAQAVIAIALQRPHDARARPMSVLGDDAGYNAVFDADARRDLFLACILLDRQILSYLSEERPELSRDVKNDIRFYMGTYLAAQLAEKTAPTKNEIALLADTVKNPIASLRLNGCCDAVLELYQQHGSNANAAKSGHMTPDLLTLLKEIHA